MNIALHILQLFLQNQLPCSLAVSVLLVIVVHVLVTCLVFWDLLSNICCNKLALPSFPQKTRRICPCSPTQAFELESKPEKSYTQNSMFYFFQTEQEKLQSLGVFFGGNISFVCVGFGIFCLFFFLGNQKVTICKGSKILYISLDSIPELLDFLFLFVFKIHRANKTLDQMGNWV